MGLKLVDVDVENFRSFHDVKFTTGRKITAISGQNGVGKSNLVSLIASGSGLNRKANFGSNFQPEFYSFFNIDPTEDYPHYSLFLKYEEPGKQGRVVKKLTFKDETATKRGLFREHQHTAQIFHTKKHSRKRKILLMLAALRESRFLQFI